MKRRYINHSNTNSLTKEYYYFEEQKNEFVNGYVAVIEIYEANKKTMVPREGREDDCVLDIGYKLFRIFDKTKSYCIVAIYNENFEFIEFYIDCIDNICYDNELNIPYMEDLFLDIVYTNKDEIIVLDEDELKEAYNNRDITKEQYEKVLKSKEEVLRLLNDKKYVKSLKNYCLNELKRLYKKLNK